MMRARRSPLVLLGLVITFVVAALSMWPGATMADSGSSPGQGSYVTPIEAWVAHYDGPAGSNDQAYALAVDHKGNAYVTGGSDGGVSGTRWDYATVKYDRKGNEVWVARYNGPGNLNDYAEAIAVDRRGNVYVTGHSYGAGSGTDYATIKYDHNGNELWIARYNGPGNLHDYAIALAVDRKGNVYVTGRSWGAGSAYDYTTIKYDRNGNELWVAQYNGPGNGYDWAFALDVDRKGNVYVTGLSYVGGNDFDYATVKYDRDGNEVWVARYDGPGNSHDYAYALALDKKRNVYVTGVSYGAGTGFDYATVKYDRDGNELWVARYNGPGNGDDAGNDIAVDRKGSIYVTGESYGGTDTGRDYATVAYDRNGGEMWVVRYNGPGSWDDYATAVAVGPRNRVYVTGYAGSVGVDWDYATILIINATTGRHEHNAGDTGSDDDNGGKKNKHQKRPGKGGG